MKKFKFFALTALFCAMGLNAFGYDTQATIGVYKVQYTMPASPTEPAVDGQIYKFKNDVTAAEIKDLIIPATLTDNVNGNIVVNIKSINLSGEEAATIAMVESINMSGATNLTTIEEHAFDGCTSLASITFGAALEEIGAEAFNGTAVTTIDLSGTKVTEINPFVTASNYNSTITTVKLPAKLNTIHDGAFSYLKSLETIDWSACENGIIVGDGTGGVFVDCMKYKTVVWPANVAIINDDALKGSRIESLTLNSYVNPTDPLYPSNYPWIYETGETTVKTLIVNGDFGGFFDEGAFTSLETLTFQGKVVEGALKYGSFAGCVNLATVNFNGELEALAVEGGAFAQSGDYEGAGSALYEAILPADLNEETARVLTINYPNATATSPANPFEDDAFADPTYGYMYNHAKLVTSEAFIAVFKTEEEFEHSNLVDEVIYGLYVENAPAPVEKDLLAVATKAGSSSFYYAKLIAEPGRYYKIAKKQGEDKHMVVVYSAYVDASDATIYMNNLRIVDGYYHVPANVPVIVKSATADDVELEPWITAETPEIPEATGGIQGYNAIDIPETNIMGDNFKALPEFEGLGDPDLPQFIPYFLAPIAENGFLWAKIADDRNLYTVGYYNPATKETTADFIIAVNNKDFDNAPAARVVWLDGTEDDSTTGIEFIEASKNTKSGVIYNLAGQKVDNNYKGVIIVNGQKKIQK